ncbi:MAG: tripartite tricarboxylate transporter substrate binding protein [Burkholderiales bacterium]
MRLSILALIYALLVGSAIAQDAYPSKPVRIVSPSPAGGPNDVMARLYAQRLGERAKTTFIVENRVGATGTVGTDYVVKALPDGYTVLFTVDLPITMAPALFKVPYEVTRDLQPVAGVLESMNLLAVHPSIAANSLAELIALGKAKPGALTFASAGNASPGHVCGELLKGASGVDFTHVPYKGAAPASTAVLSGEVSMFCGPIPMLAPQVKNGKLRALGVTGPRPSPLVPELTPLSATMPGLVVTNWYGVFVPLKTPPAVVDYLRGEFRRVTDDPEVRQRLTTMGLDVRWMDTAELTQAIHSDLARWTKVVRDANIKAD